jgi:hypothetical protein
LPFGLAGWGVFSEEAVECGNVGFDLLYRFASSLDLFDYACRRRSPFKGTALVTSFQRFELLPKESALLFAPLDMLGQKALQSVAHFLTPISLGAAGASESPGPSHYVRLAAVVSAAGESGKGAHPSRYMLLAVSVTL